MLQLGDVGVGDALLFRQRRKGAQTIPAGIQARDAQPREFLEPGRQQSVAAQADVEIEERRNKVRAVIEHAQEGGVAAHRFPACGEGPDFAGQGLEGGQFYTGGHTRPPGSMSFGQYGQGRQHEQCGFAPQEPLE